jgi:hypothetical protein
LLRFYADGTALHTALCSADVAKNWGDVRKWFCKESIKDIGRGFYQLEGGQIRFTTVTRFRAWGREVTVDFKGEYTPERLHLVLYNLSANSRDAMDFVRLNVDIS